MVDLGILLKNLSTLEGRTKVVKERIDSEDKIPEKYINETIDFFEERGNEYTHILTNGAEIARKGDREDKAIKMYNEAIDRETKRGYLGYAARIADEAQMFERAIDLHLKASEKSKREKDFYSAAIEVEEASNSARASGKVELMKELEDRAKELFVKTIKNFKEYITKNKTVSYDNERILKIIQEITKKAEMPEKNSELYKAVIKNYEGRWDTIPGAGYRDAAYFAEEVGMNKRAKELNLLAIEGFVENRYYEAQKLAEKVGVLTLPRKLQEKILKSMEKNRSLEEVAEFAEKIGLDDKTIREFYIKAMEAYERQGYFKKSADFAEKVGMHNKAKLYKELAVLIGKDRLSF